ncbi:PepSY-like domain-containing protein [Chitinophaga sp. MM2321]|uniref:PepSY-like domain-containing protein n=1 Tax=Chitinophaga sp. MM2321 TaxID=3137178 RepID=UPI0032D57D10
MKKYLLLTAIFAGIATAGFSQVKVPATARTAFEKAFPGATNVKWGKEGATAYEANFVQHHKHMSAVYDHNGVLQETEETIAIAALPAGVTAYVKEHYKGAPVKEAAKITKADGVVNYEAEVNKKDVMFDAQGKFLKEVIEN